MRVVGQRADEVAAPHDRPLVRQPRDHDERQHAEDHLPRRHGQEVVAALDRHRLEHDDADRPRDAGAEREQAARRVRGAGPELEHEHEAEENQSGRRPLPAAQPIRQERPAEHDDPERHRVTEHGALPRGADVERPRDQADEPSRLKQTEKDRLHDVLRLQRRADGPQHAEQQQRAEDAAQRREIHRADVLHRQLHDDPVVAPDQREQRRARAEARRSSARRR